MNPADILLYCVSYSFSLFFLCLSFLVCFLVLPFFFPWFFFFCSFIYETDFSSNHKMEDPWGLMVCVRGIWGTFGILVAVLCGKNGQHHVCYCDVGLACWFVVCVCVCVGVALLTLTYKPVNNTRLSAKPTLWLAFAPISSVRTICDWLLLMLAKSDKWPS